MKKVQLHIGLLLLRLSLGILMLFHGVAKIERGVGGIQKLLERHELPGILAYAVFIGEIVAPLMLLLGYRTRIAAILFAVTMVVAAWLGHPDEILALGKNGEWALELIALYFFGALALLFTGAGKFAVSTKSKWD